MHRCIFTYVHMYIEKYIYMYTFIHVIHVYMYTLHTLHTLHTYIDSTLHTCIHIVQKHKVGTLQLSSFLAGDYRLGMNFLPTDEAKIKAWPWWSVADGKIYR